MTGRPSKIILMSVYAEHLECTRCQGAKAGGSWLKSREARVAPGTPGCVETWMRFNSCEPDAFVVLGVCANCLSTAPLPYLVAQLPGGMFPITPVLESVLQKSC